MRPIGFSTGALALADFRRALAMLEPEPEVSVIELSALRMAELAPLVRSLDGLGLERFSYTAFHAPSSVIREQEREVVAALEIVAARGWPIVVHPNAVHDWSLWRQFGRLLCLENMDKRKPIGRSVAELAGCFDKVPDASLCLDLGHARQVDPSMTGAFLLLREFGPRLMQLHLSEVGTDSRHDRLSYSASVAFQQIASFIPEAIPVVLETPVSGTEILQEIRRARAALAPGSARQGQREAPGSYAANV